VIREGGSGDIDLPPIRWSLKGGLAILADFESRKRGVGSESDVRLRSSTLVIARPRSCLSTCVPNFVCSPLACSQSRVPGLTTHESSQDIPYRSPIRTNPQPTSSSMPATTIFSKITLVLDLDATLIQSYDVTNTPTSTTTTTDNCFSIENSTTKILIVKRPGLDAFLREASTRFNVVLFSAGASQYCTEIVNRLDPEGVLFSQKFCRDHCSFVDGLGLTKDLRILNLDLARVVLVDDCILNFYFQTSNGIPVAPFAPTLQHEDTLLTHSLPALLSLLEFASDVRPVLQGFFFLDVHFQHFLNFHHREMAAAAAAAAAESSLAVVEVGGVKDRVG
jgi:Dullard-like phosphatase family protein